MRRRNGRIARRSRPARRLFIRRSRLSINLCRGTHSQGRRDGAYSWFTGCRGGHSRRVGFCRGRGRLGRARPDAGQAAVSIGHPELVSMDEAPDDAYIATAAAIGAPAGTTEWQMLGVDYVKAVEMLQEALGAPIYGLMIGQNGMSSTMNAWLPSAMLGTKVIDAVGDIRAHPTGDMGSIGMASSPEADHSSRRGRPPRQQFLYRAGGARRHRQNLADPAQGRRYVGRFHRELPQSGSRILCQENAALGGISRALELGSAILAAEANGGDAIIDAICKADPAPFSARAW